MSEKEDKEGHPTRQLTQQKLNQPTATTGPSPVGRGVITEIPLTSC